jgi:cathepsin L
VAAVAAAAPAAPALQPLGPSIASFSFERFVEQFGRDYKPGTAEYAKRRQIFEERLRSILAHNTDTTNTWTRGVNEFADLSDEEFKSSGRLGYKKQIAQEHRSRMVTSEFANKTVVDDDDMALSSLPESVDWREKGIVSPVKDQGHCGSCWAFATTETVESHVALATGTLETLSPQELVSCAVNPYECGGTGGCGGSIPELAYTYIQLYGLTTEWMTPYTSYAGKTETCPTNFTTRAQATVGITGYRKLTPNSYQDVMSALAQIGPLAVNVDASKWHDYSSGVFSGCPWGEYIDINHVVQLVGYGIDANLGKFWLVRNSWDATWGENGYIRLERSSNECGKDKDPLDGTGCKGGPLSDDVVVCGTCGLLFDVSYPIGGQMLVHGHHLMV